jgi:hypothetical protein
VDRDGDVKYKNGSDQVYYMTNGNSHNWSFATDKTYNCGITTAGAGTYRFIWNITDKKMTVTYPNFVIYRTGDKADDPRAQNTDVESYDGGTIEKAIEFRMKVQTIDQWYSLSLPFAVSAVKVWDDEDGAYYDIVPFYRSGGKFYTGHYIIRKPETVTNYAIETFEEKWVDPDNSMVVNARGGFWVSQKRYGGIDPYAFLAHIHPDGYEEKSTYGRNLQKHFQFAMSTVERETFSGLTITPHSTTKQLLSPHTPILGLAPLYPTGQIALYEKEG